MQTLDREADNQRNYDRLMVALEASQGKLDLLIAVCEDRNLQEQVIQQYSAELQQQEIPHYRVLVRRRDPSLRYALEQLVQQQPELQQAKTGVATVQGLEDLLANRLGAERSEQEWLLGYLQWTREALRDFQFPVVIWVNRQLLTQLVEKSPDFWSWRGGVFWFGLDAMQSLEVPLAAINLPNPEKMEPEIIALLQLIEQLEQQPDRDEAQLATLYEQLGQVYTQRGNSGNHRQFAIQVYKRVIQLQRKLGSLAELAESLERLGDLYFETRNEVKLAHEAYQEAIGLYREVGSRLGEANTLKAIGDVLQFLKCSSESLSQYEQAIGLYREVGSRLGEANVLQAFGKLQADPQTGLNNLQQAQQLYEQIGSQYSQSRNLQFIADRQLELQQTDLAIESLQRSVALAEAIDYEPLRQAALDKLAELQSDESADAGSD